MLYWWRQAGDRAMLPVACIIQAVVASLALSFAAGAVLRVAVARRRSVLAIPSAAAAALLLVGAMLPLTDIRTGLRLDEARVLSDVAVLSARTAMISERRASDASYHPGHDRRVALLSFAVARGLPFPSRLLDDASTERTAAAVHTCITGPVQARAACLAATSAQTPDCAAPTVGRSPFLPFVEVITRRTSDGFAAPVPRDLPRTCMPDTRSLSYPRPNTALYPP